MTTSLPALQIQFMYPFISFSSFCSSFKSRKPALDSTLSFSFANSLYRKQLFVHQAFAHTEKKGKHEKYFCSSFIKVSAVESSRVGGLRFDIWQNLQHWMPGVGSNERKIKFVKTFLNFTASWRKY